MGHSRLQPETLWGKWPLGRKGLHFYCGRLVANYYGSKEPKEFKRVPLASCPNLLNSAFMTTLKKKGSHSRKSKKRKCLWRSAAWTFWELRLSLLKTHRGVKQWSSSKRSAKNWDGPGEEFLQMRESARTIWMGKRRRRFQSNQGSKGFCMGLKTTRSSRLFTREVTPQMKKHLGKYRSSKRHDDASSIRKSRNTSVGESKDLKTSNFLYPSISLILNESDGTSSLLNPLCFPLKFVMVFSFELLILISLFNSVALSPLIHFSSPFFTVLFHSPFNFFLFTRFPPEITRS